MGTALFAGPRLLPFSPVPNQSKLTRLLSSSAVISSSIWWANPCWVDGGGSDCVGVRKIWTFSPVCMGRRSSKIAGRKGAQDAKKAKLYSRIGKEFVSAMKKGGPNPTSNTMLAAVLYKAKALDVPKDILERNIKKASEKGQEAYIEKIYEVDDKAMDLNKELIARLLDLDDVDAVYTDQK